MMEDRREFLNRELFILNSKLRMPLLAVRGLSFQVSRWELIEIISDEVRTLDTFNDDQEEKRFETSEQLQKLEGNVKEIVVKACDKSYSSFLEENRISADITGEETNKEGEP
jgi:hypothetical protein